MTPALKAMIEAMAAEIHRQTKAGEARMNFSAPDLFGVELKEANLEKVARAGLAVSMDGLALALCVADGEEPEAFHSRAEREASDHGLQLTDHAIPLWMRYRSKARRAIDEILKETP